MISIADLKLPNKQPRRFFDNEKLDQLQESVHKYGILEPLIVRPLTGGQYELIAGERRYRAAKAEKLTTVPVIVRDLNDQEAFELALLENLQRDDLNPIDETEGILDLLCQTLGLNQEELISLLNQAANADRRGIKLTDNVIRKIETVDRLFKTVGRLTRESFRSNRLPLLSLPEDVLEYLRGGKLEYTKAKAISKLSTEAKRRSLAEETIKNKLSLREVKQKVSESLRDPKGTAKKGSLKDSFKALVKTKSSAWNDESKHSKIEALLTELEGLLLADRES
ncbi:MAG: ParB/RepB/Spo0J family partition protein [Cyanobacteria bacterium J06650_10]